MTCWWRFRYERAYVYEDLGNDERSRNDLLQILRGRSRLRRCGPATRNGVSLARPHHACRRYISTTRRIDRSARLSRRVRHNKHEPRGIDRDGL